MLDLEKVGINECIPHYLFLFCLFVQTFTTGTWVPMKF